MYFSKRFVFLLFINIYFSIFSENIYSAASQAGPDREGSSSYLSPLRFKVGFEFQEVSGLCPWARGNLLVYDQPLFGREIYTKSGTSRLLWKVVLDGPDIEIVTSPFSDDESDLLNICMETISQITQDLNRHLQQKKNITFDEWISGLDGLVCYPTYEFVCNKSLERNADNWALQFAPQVTIQHPLEWTIFLSYALLGFDSPEMMNFSSAVPYRDIILEALQNRNTQTLSEHYRNLCCKKSGLVFLHALTLASLTPAEQKDGEFLAESLQHWKNYGQVNAKMKLPLMSRRPFSSMYTDICTTSGSFSYVDCFNNAITGCNLSFMNVSQVPQLFSKTNYGRKFYNPDTQSASNLSTLIPLFEESFFRSNEEVIRALLHEGVITTTMIRHIRGYEPLLRDYFSITLESVEKPHNRYSLNIQDVAEPFFENSVYDALSPPWFLDPDDSMGRLKAPLAEVDKKFGEAIVEVRAIRSVGPWFLRRAGLTDTDPGLFLTKPDALKREAMALFDCFKSFTPQDCCDIFRNIMVALRKY